MKVPKIGRIVNVCAFTAFVALLEVLLGQRTSFDAQDVAPIELLVSPAPYVGARPVPNVFAARNPFELPPGGIVRPTTIAAQGEETATNRLQGDFGEAGSQAGDLPVLPANAGAAGVPVPIPFETANPVTREPDARVLAVTSGAISLALIQTGSTSEIYRAGDRFRGKTIRSIGLQGVTFNDGTLLPVWNGAE